jgi:hypothetical protein
LNHALTAAARHPSGLTFVDLREPRRFTGFFHGRRRSGRGRALLGRAEIKGKGDAEEDRSRLRLPFHFEVETPLPPAPHPLENGDDLGRHSLKQLLGSDLAFHKQNHADTPQGTPLLEGGFKLFSRKEPLGDEYFAEPVVPVRRRGVDDHAPFEIEPAADLVAAHGKAAVDIFGEGGLQQPVDGVVSQVAPEGE